MRSTLNRLTIVILAAVSIVLQGCGTDGRPDGRTSVRYGYLPIASDLSFFVALEDSLFREQQIDVRPVEFETSNQALEALVAGRVDATAIVALQAALAVSAADPGQFFISEMTAADSTTAVHKIVVLPESEIRDIAGLEGRNVGTFPGSQMETFLRLIVASHFPAEQVTVSQLSPSLQPQALRSGQIDALFCLEPTCTIVEQEFGATPISVNPLYEYLLQPFPTAVGLISRRLAQDHPEVAQGIIDVLTTAHSVIDEEPSRAKRMLVNYAPVDSTTAAAIGVYDYWAQSEIDRTAVQQLVELYLREDLLEQQPPLDSLFAYR